MSQYLAASDFAAYGLPTATTTAAIVQASNAVDFILKRPEGVVWVPDANGSPCYMAGLTPSLTFTISGAIAPGVNVPLTLSPPIATQDLVGDVLVLDRSEPDSVEAIRVSAVTSPGSIVAAAVQFAHADKATADQGLLITEERSLPAKRSITRVARLPLVRMTAAQGRYGYGRRSDQGFGTFDDMNLLSAVQAFGGPPLWIDVDPGTVSASPSTGEVWFPGGTLLAYYSDVRMRYVAGWPAANIPSAIKTATAQIVSGASSPDAGGNVKRISAGGESIERFSASYLDADTKAMLAPYQARVFF